MATRVYELAKELGMSNKEMLNKLNGMGIEVSSHMNAVSDKDCLAVRNSMAKNRAPKDVKSETKNKSADAKGRSGEAPGEKQENRPAKPKGKGRPVQNGQQKSGQEKRAWYSGRTYAIFPSRAFTSGSRMNRRS